MLRIKVTRQVVFPTGFVATELTGKSFMVSMLEFSVPLEGSPETEDTLARNAVVSATLSLEVAQPTQY